MTGHAGSAATAAVPVTLGALAVRHGCELRGDPDLEVDHVAPLGDAGPRAVTFLANPAYRDQLSRTTATVVILQRDDLAACPAAALVAAQPYVVFARIAAELHPVPPVRAGVHPRAVVGERCVVPPSCEVGPGAVLGTGVVLGERVYVGANAVLAAGVRIGDDTRVMAGAVLYAAVRTGSRCIVHSGAVLGADGFGMAKDAGGAWVKVPQLGTVVLGDDVEVGANTTIDRGAIGDTVIEDGVKLDNQIQIGHNCVIGRHTAIAAMAGISGSTRIGARCMIGGKVGMAGHQRICDDVILVAGSMVSGDIAEPGIYGGPIVATDARSWRRNTARFYRLDRLARRVDALERRAGQDARDDE